MRLTNVFVALWIAGLVAVGCDIGNEEADTSETVSMEDTQGEDSTSSCGNSVCEENENPCTCPEDCPEDCSEQNDCGNGVCDDDETPCSCPDDCLQGVACCEDSDCPQPLCGPCCQAQCVEFRCQDVWLDNCCWNDVCEEGENHENCPEDCPAPDPCGDGTCGDDEDPCSCPEDCLTEMTCCDDSDCPMLDCGPCCYIPCVDHLCTEATWLDNCCWNGKCEESETWENCPEDCGEPTECEKEGGTCVIWQPGGSCEDGFEEVGFMCESKSEACCMAVDQTADCANPFACQTTEDCVKADGDCCGCANGGISIALNVNCVESWHSQLECDGVGCLTVYLCDDTIASCVNNQCVLVEPDA